MYTCCIEGAIVISSTFLRKAPHEYIVFLSLYTAPCQGDIQEYLPRTEYLPAVQEYLPAVQEYLPAVQECLPARWPRSSGSNILHFPYIVFIPPYKDF